MERENIITLCYLIVLVLAVKAGLHLADMSFYQLVQQVSRIIELTS